MCKHESVRVKFTQGYSDLVVEDVATTDVDEFKNLWLFDKDGGILALIHEGQWMGIFHEAAS